MRAVALIGLLLLVPSPVLDAQGRRGAPPPAAEPAGPRNEQALVNCPSVLGDGVQTSRTYCDVQVGNDAEAGIIVTLPPHDGDVTLSFDLHNRHVYSAELVKERRAYSRYAATIGVLTMNNDLMHRFAVLNEFRTEADLFDRVSGGSAATGLKAVAPTGLEPISIVIPAAHERVSILGEKLQVVRADGEDHFETAGRPIALISNVRVTYSPAPPKPAPRRR